MPLVVLNDGETYSEITGVRIVDSRLNLSFDLGRLWDIIPLSILMRSAVGEADFDP